MRADLDRKRYLEELKVYLENLNEGGSCLDLMAMYLSPNYIQCCIVTVSPGKMYGKS